MRRHKNALNTEDAKIGYRLRYARTERGITQAQLSEAFGISAQQFQKFEMGLNRISAKLLHRVAMVLERPIEWFLQDLDLNETTQESDPHTALRFNFSKAAMKSFSGINDPRIQRQLLLLIQLVMEILGKEEK